MAKYFTDEQLNGQIVERNNFTILKTSNSEEILDIPGGEHVVGTYWNSDGALMVDIIHIDGYMKGRYFFLGQHVRYGGILPEDRNSNRPTSPDDLRRYMTDVQAARQQREGRPSSSENNSTNNSSTSDSFAKGVATGAAVLGAISNWADKREAKKLERKAAEVAAKAAKAQQEREEREEEKREEEWWNSLSPEEKKFRNKLDDLIEKISDDEDREREKIEKLPMPSEENFIKEYKTALEKSKDSNKTPKYILDYINSYPNVPEDIAEALEEGEYGMDLNYEWEKRTNDLRDYAIKHYMDNPEIRQLFAEDYQEKLNEDTKNKKNKKIAKIFWSVYAIVALILLIKCEEWWEYVLVIIGLILAAIIKVYIRMRSDLED